MRASWGAFEIWVNGVNLCSHLEEGGILPSVSWHLLPLFEWLIENWDALLHEERLPVRNVESDAWSSIQRTAFPPYFVEKDTGRLSAWEQAWSSWWRRHALRAARDGGLFPDVVFRRLRDDIEVSWGPTPLAGMPEHYRFTCDRGRATVAPETVAGVLFDVLSSAIDHLLERLPESSTLRELRRRVTCLSTTETDRRLMWLAALGADEQTMQTRWRAIKQRMIERFNGAADALLAAKTGPDHLVISDSGDAALMLASAAPDIQESDAVTLAQYVVDLSRMGRESDRLCPLERTPPPPSYQIRPWQQGYELAKDFLQALGADQESAPLDIAGIIRDLGIDAQERMLITDSVRGLAVASPDHQPGILVNTTHAYNRHGPGKRFGLAHELCHILYDRSRGRRLALSSGSWAPEDLESRANAFAAMVLMPERLVEKAVSHATEPINSKAGVLEVAQRLQCGWHSVLWHLRNLGYIDTDARQRVDREDYPPDIDGN